jgi:putative transport protein
VPSVYDIFSQPFVVLFAVIALGLWFGSLQVRGISLGSAGVLFAGLIVGHVRQSIPDGVVASHPNVLALPPTLTELGLLLFVYAVGLHAGPRFVPMFRSRVKAYLLIGLGSVGSAAVTAVALGHLFHFSPALTTGLFTGALTNTPALAAGRDVVQRLAPSSAAEVSVGHGLAYPFSAILIVVLVQLLPRLVRQSPQEAAQQAAREASERQPHIRTRCFWISNPNIAGSTVADFHRQGLTRATISRIKREGVVYPALPEMDLQLHDAVLAVGPEPDLNKLTSILGRPADDVTMEDTSGRVTSEVAVVSSPAVVDHQLGQVLTGAFADVIVTRVRRQGVDLLPDPALVLEPTDALRVVGNPEVVRRFAEHVGSEQRRLSETSLLSFAVGVCLGAVVGMIPIPLFGGVQGKLGLGGGAFIVGLLLGHARRIGPFRIFVPEPVILFARELGLVVFLAGAGLEAGRQFLHVLQIAGAQALLAGAVVTCVASVVTLLLTHRVLRWNVLASAGTLSGTMTNPPALNAATALAHSDAAPLAFASIYPVAIIAKIILVQFAFLTARLWQ